MPLRDFGDANVRSGSETDIFRANTDVRFNPRKQILQTVIGGCREFATQDIDGHDVGFGQVT
jgi:hypothetical protein